MKLFKAEYDWHGSRGAYEEIKYIVVANTEEEALGLVLEAEEKTSSDFWNIEEIDATVPAAHWISECAS